MLVDLGRDWATLPLLPAGSELFAGLPVGALVLDALAPAIGNGIITLSDGGSEGVLVVRSGVVTERVWVANGARSHGDDARALIRSAETAMVSARKLPDEAMLLLGPLLHGYACYSDLRLEWVVWSQFLADLRSRDRAFVVEVTTPSGRGVTCLEGGRQVATYAESHPMLGDASLLDDIAAGGVGTIRVLVDDGAGDEPRRALSHVAAPYAAAARPEQVAAAAIDAAQPEPVASVALAMTRSEEVAPDVLTPARYEPVPSAAARPTIASSDDPNATFSAMFGSHVEISDEHPSITLDNTPKGAGREVASVLPQLRLLVQNRLQRSSESVENIVESAAVDHQSVEWLSDRVRVMTMRGFLPSTFHQLADDMITLAGREPS